MTGPFPPNARIQQRIADVHHEVVHHEKKDGQLQVGDDHGSVQQAEAVNQRLTDAGPGKDRFRHHGKGDHVAGFQAQNSHDGDQEARESQFQRRGQPRQDQLHCRAVSDKGGAEIALRRSGQEQTDGTSTGMSSTRRRIVSFCSARSATGLIGIDRVADGKEAAEDDGRHDGNDQKGLPQAGILPHQRLEQVLSRDVVGPEVVI